MIEELQAIREQLFDAPTEVKESFNEVVKYFDGKGSADHCYIVVGLLEDNNGNKDTKNTWFIAYGSESDAVNEFKNYFGNYKCSNIKAFRTPLTEVKGKSKSHKAPDWNSNAGKEAYSYESELYNKYVKDSPIKPTGKGKG